MEKIKKWFKYKIASFKYNFNFLKVLNSPFKPLTATFYFGDIIHGTPYFLPRKWVKMTQKDCEECLERDKKSTLPKYIEGRTWEYYKNYTKPVPVKYLHWHFTTLGWKTKWDDYRFEWSPSLSIVILGKQLFVSILPNIEKYKRFGRDVMKIDCYWESWLNWEYNTDKTKSKEVRFKELVSKHSNTWGNDKEGFTDYYPMIINKKYLNLYNKIK